MPIALRRERRRRPANTTAVHERRAPTDTETIVLHATVGHTIAAMDADGSITTAMPARVRDQTTQRNLDAVTAEARGVVTSADATDINRATAAAFTACKTLTAGVVVHVGYH